MVTYSSFDFVRHMSYDYPSLIDTKYPEVLFYIGKSFIYKIDPSNINMQ